MSTAALLLLWTVTTSATGLNSLTPAMQSVPANICEKIGKAAVQNIKTDPRASARFACIDENGKTFASGN